VGICKSGTQTCVASPDHTSASWSACTGVVLPKTRDCSSNLDNDCNGAQDNMETGFCKCTPNSTQQCAGSNTGVCRSGTQTCLLSTDHTTSSWGSCAGVILPGPRNCSSANDNDCNGTADNLESSFCKCAPGATQACSGSSTGICRPGTKTCNASADGTTSDWGTQCVGQVLPATRNCASTADNDCNGTADNLETAFCTCSVGASQKCPGNNTGICNSGTQTCTAGTGTSAWGPCIGVVTPRARDCSSTSDNDCNGTADNLESSFCTCAVGATQSCGSTTINYCGTNVTNTGACHAGTSTCVTANGNTTSTWGACQGAQGPTTEICSPQATSDLDCDGVVGDGCRTLVTAVTPDTNWSCNGGTLPPNPSDAMITGGPDVNGNYEAGWKFVSSFKTWGQSNFDTSLVKMQRCNCANGHTIVFGQPGATTVNCPVFCAAEGDFGYVSTVAKPGYDQLWKIQWGAGIPHMILLAGVSQALFCTTGCNCTFTGYYVMKSCF
jgi:hypothetical protein